MRAHTTFGTPDQEPWSYGPRFEEINRRAIEMRYQLLPQIYTVMEEASRTGLPALRPLLLEYPDDPATYQRQDEFLFGRDLLVAPVLREGATEREVYLPKGTWYEYAGRRRYEGGRSIPVPVTMDAIPVFVRGGAIVFRQPVVQHTGEMAGQTLRLLVSAADAAEGTQYEDDGHSLAHQRGVFPSPAVHRAGRRRTMDAAGGGAGRLVPSGRARPRGRGARARGAAVGDGGHGSAGPRGRGGLGHRAAGWRRTDDGALLVRTRDRFEPFTITVSR